jgi:hypothetical protein
MNIAKQNQESEWANYISWFSAISASTMRKLTGIKKFTALD